MGGNRQWVVGRVLYQNTARCSDTMGVLYLGDEKNWLRGRVDSMGLNVYLELKPRTETRQGVAMECYII